MATNHIRHVKIQTNSLSFTECFLKLIWGGGQSQNPADARREQVSPSRPTCRRLFNSFNQQSLCVINTWISWNVASRMIVFAVSSSDLRNRSIFWVDSCPSPVWGRSTPIQSYGPKLEQERQDEQLARRLMMEDSWEGCVGGSKRKSGMYSGFYKESFLPKNGWCIRSNSCGWEYIIIATEECHTIKEGTKTKKKKASIGESPEKHHKISGGVAHTVEADFLGSKFGPPKFGSSKIQTIPRSSVILLGELWTNSARFFIWCSAMLGIIRYDQILKKIFWDEYVSWKGAAPNSCNSFILLCVYLRQEMASLSLAGRGWQCGVWMMICWSVDSKQHALVLQGFGNLPSKTSGLKIQVA